MKLGDSAFSIACVCAPKANTMILANWARVIGFSGWNSPSPAPQTTPSRGQAQ